MKIRKASCFRLIVIAAYALSTSMLVLAQAADPAQHYPTHFPFTFSNAVWWNDDELHTLLKKRIPGLGDEIAPTAEAEAKIRESLKALLRAKGIAAEVQSEEPSSFSLTAQRVPGAEPPAIVFSILSPRILVNKVVASHSSETLSASLNQTLKTEEGRDYSSYGFTFSPVEDKTAAAINLSLDFFKISDRSSVTIH